ncbi:hypothetical protein GGI43DRAFT_418464 [Trichoderma evansii]
MRSTCLEYWRYTALSLCAAFGLGGVGCGFSCIRPRQFFGIFIQLFLRRGAIFCSLSNFFKLLFFLSYSADQFALDAPSKRPNRQPAQLAAAS